MEKRVLFNSSEIRDLFFKKVLEKNNLSTWNQLSIFLNIRRSLLSSYRNGKFTLPEKTYSLLNSKFEKKDLNYFSKNISLIDEGWGRIKAGKITYSRHKNIFDEGRRKAILTTKERTHKFDLNLALGSELAYFIGLFIGDGFTNKYGKYYLIQFTGDKKEELFYKTLITDYCKKLFNITPKIKDDRISKAIRVNIYSIDLFNLITQRFKIPAGRKSRIVLIPEEILNSKPEIIQACLRGLYDAEGCVFLDKRKSYKVPYPRIELHMCNLKLLKQVYDLLTGFGIKCILGKSENNLRVTIWGFEEVNKFVKKIGFSNPKQLEKLKTLKN